MGGDMLNHGLVSVYQLKVSDLTEKIDMLEARIKEQAHQIVALQGVVDDLVQSKGLILVHCNETTGTYTKIGEGE